MDVPLVPPLKSPSYSGPKHVCIELTLSSRLTGPVLEHLWHVFFCKYNSLKIPI